MTVETGDFYEDDEPIEDVLAAWEHGTDVVTSEPPTRGMNLVLDAQWMASEASLGLTVAAVRVRDPRPDKPMVAHR